MRGTIRGSRLVQGSAGQARLGCDLRAASAARIPPATSIGHPLACLARRSTAWGSRRVPRPRPAMTSATSPRAGIAPSRTAASSSASVPRATCSWSFVSSRQTAARRSAPHAAARSRSVAASRVGASNSTVARSSAAIRASRSRRSRPDARQEALEPPARAGEPARGDRGEDGRRARDRHDPPALGGPRGHELAARVADGRRAGVGHEREVGAAAQVLQELPVPARPAAGVVAHEPRLDLVARQQPPGDPRVLGRDERHRPQRLERPERDVAEVADRRGHDEQRSASQRPRAADGSGAPRAIGRQVRAEPGRRLGYR